MTSGCQSAALLSPDGQPIGVDPRHDESRVRDHENTVDDRDSASIGVPVDRYRDLRSFAGEDLDDLIRDLEAGRRLARLQDRGVKRMSFLRRGSSASMMTEIAMM
jgi:hypothetical protein